MLCIKTGTSGRSSAFVSTFSISCKHQGQHVTSVSKYPEASIKQTWKRERNSIIKVQDTNITKDCMRIYKWCNTWTTSRPRTTRPKTVYRLSKWGEGTVVIKNCDLFVFGPEFAIDKTNASCFNLRNTSYLINILLWGKQGIYTMLQR